MISKKKEEKIKNKDTRINITYELSLAQEEYNSAVCKYEETNDIKYKAMYFHKLTILELKNFTKTLLS